MHSMEADRQVYELYDLLDMATQSDRTCPTLHVYVHVSIPKYITCAEREMVLPLILGCCISISMSRRCLQAKARTNSGGSRL